MTLVWLEIDGKQGPRRHSFGTRVKSKSEPEPEVRETPKEVMRHEVVVVVGEVVEVVVEVLRSPS